MDERNFLPDVMLSLLTAVQMRDAEALAMAQGVSGYAMMCAAGQAVVDVMMQRLPLLDHRFWVLCGAGNNGGDGFVVARLLMAQGFAVQCVCSLGLDGLRGDALTAAQDFKALAGGAIQPLSMFAPQRGDVVVDALFGTGLTRAIEGEALDAIKRLRASKATVFAVDIPSGYDANTGEPCGSIAQAVKADVTIAFAAKKPAHVILPAKSACGEVVLVDIGIESCVLAQPTNLLENHPLLWRKLMPLPRMDSHKYARGAVLVVGGDKAHTGAARMAARAAARICGAVTIACDDASLPIYAAHCTAIMTEIAEDAAAIEALLSGLRRYAVVAGPASGINRRTRGAVLSALQVGAPLVIDADALSVFSMEDGAREILFAAIKRSSSPVVMTPHEGEFHRMFATKKDELSMLHDKLSRARAAAQMSGAVVLLKGNDTIIAHPDGRTVVNTNAPAYLATAGAGDVLAGLIAGWMATGMTAFDAACASAYVHGRAAEIGGLGLIADELPELIPLALSEMVA